MPPPCDLRRDLAKLLETEKGADVVFEVGGETLAAHRCVLAARSSVFAAELFGPMKEGNAAAAGSLVVPVEDMEAEVFKALLRYAYTGSLPQIRKEDEDATCQHLLTVADRYGMERLKLICEEKLCKYINVGTAVTILVLAEQHHCEGLKKACFKFLATPANLKAVVATDALQQLSASCPSLMVELMAMSLAHSWTWYIAASILDYGDAKKLSHFALVSLVYCISSTVQLTMNCICSRGCRMIRILGNGSSSFQVIVIRYCACFSIGYSMVPEPY